MRFVLLSLFTVLWGSFYQLLNVDAFSVSNKHGIHHESCSKILMSKNDNEPSGYCNEKQTRRNFFTNTASITATSLLVQLPTTTTAARADTGAEVRGTQLNAFNSLTFQYRGNDFAGLKAEDLNEPSISYEEFVSKLKAGQVTFVEFMAPDGDAAYATIKDDNGTKPPIRIGEGYPIEQHDGYSSPAFAIRTVKNAGVPYKFTVPALSGYKNRS